jgi:hypothetical protein
VDLRWWPVALAGFACLAAVVVLAALLPLEQVRRRLLPLAHTSRLTRLPEYARLARTRSAAAIIAIALLLLVFGAAMLASARPTATWWTTADAAEHEDIMLCIAQPVTDAATGQLLSYYARQVATFGSQRIGLTSPNRRVVPLTRDYRYAAGQFGEFAELARIQASRDAGNPLSVAESTTLRDRSAVFSPPVSYVDYAPSVADVLALCLTGFPPFESRGARGRTLIYLGPGAIRDPAEERPALFTDHRVTDMAREAGVQVNAVATPARETDTLRSVAESTGGQFFRLEGDGTDRSGTSLAGNLEAIRAKPPAIGTQAAVGRLEDAPAIALTVALAASAMLGVALVVLRR